MFESWFEGWLKENFEKCNSFIKELYLVGNDIEAENFLKKVFDAGFSYCEYLKDDGDDLR